MRENSQKSVPCNSSFCFLNWHLKVHLLCCFKVHRQFPSESGEILTNAPMNSPSAQWKQRPSHRQTLLLPGLPASLDVPVTLSPRSGGGIQGCFCVQVLLCLLDLSGQLCMIHTVEGKSSSVMVALVHWSAQAWLTSQMENFVRTHGGKRSLSLILFDAFLQ